MRQMRDNSQQVYYIRMPCEIEPHIRSERTAAAARLIQFLTEGGCPCEDIRWLVQAADNAGVLGSRTIPDCIDTLSTRFPEEKVRS